MPIPWLDYFVKYQDIEELSAVVGRTDQANPVYDKKNI